MTSAEWEIMRVIWANECVLAQDVFEALAPVMGWTQSTVKTLLGRLVKKGYVVAIKIGKAYEYKAQVSKKDVLQQKLQDDLAIACHKEHGDLLQKLVESANLSKLDLQRLQQTITQLEQDAPDEVSCCCAKGLCLCHR